MFNILRFHECFHLYKKKALKKKKSWKTLMYGTQWNPLNLLGEGEKNNLLVQDNESQEKSS